MKYSAYTYIKVGGDFVPLADVVPPLDDPDYVDGAIVWTIGNETLISETHWDLVDQLWAYILNGVAELRVRGEFETYFPDQPLRLAFRRLDDDRIEVTVGADRHVVPDSAFHASIAEGGCEFFSRMLILSPEGAPMWKRYLREAEDMR